MAEPISVWPIILVFTVLFVVGLIVIAVLIFTTCKKKKNEAKVGATRPKTSTVSSNLATLEDHLYLMPSPKRLSTKSHRILEDFDETIADPDDEAIAKPDILRPTTAFRGSRRRSVTIEFLPAENNMILKVESGSNHQVRRITKTSINIGELIRRRARVAVHQGTVDYFACFLTHDSYFTFGHFCLKFGYFCLRFGYFCMKFSHF